MTKRPRHVFDEYVKCRESGKSKDECDRLVEMSINQAGLPLESTKETIRIYWGYRQRQKSLKQEKRVTADAALSEIRNKLTK